MLPDDKRLVLNLEQSIPSVAIPTSGQKEVEIGGTIDYTALVVNLQQHRVFSSVCAFRFAQTLQRIF